MRQVRGCSPPPRFRTYISLAEDIPGLVQGIRIEDQDEFLLLLEGISDLDVSDR